MTITAKMILDQVRAMDADAINHNLKPTEEDYKLLEAIHDPILEKFHTLIENYTSSCMALRVGIEIGVKISEAAQLERMTAGDPATI